MAIILSRFAVSIPILENATPLNPKLSIQHSDANEVTIEFAMETEIPINEYDVGLLERFEGELQFREEAGILNNPKIVVILVLSFG